jgi:hypothetical protein
MIMVTTSRTIPYNREVMIETIIHVIECARCNIDFGIGDDFMRRRREDHQNFYCPNGHSNVYNGKSDLEKERDRLARQLEFANTRATAAEDQAQTAERRRRAQKAANTRLKRRVANGVCPCCTRSFRDLQRHMETKHPGYVPDDDNQG